MKTFVDELVGHNYQNRKIAIIENGTWAATAARLIKGMLEKCKNLTFAETTVTIKSALDETSKGQIEKLAEELA